MQSIADGVLFGATYALLGIGFTLVFGVMHKINLSYAAASIGAAYASLLILPVIKAPPIAGLSAGGGSPAASSAAMVYLDRLPLHSLANPLATLMSTVGLLLLIDEIIVHTTAGVPLQLSRAVLRRDHPRRTVQSARRSDVRVRCSAAVCMVLLLVLLYRTKLGLATRAVSQQPAAARAVRHQHHRASTVLTFVITGVVGGIAGAMIGAAIGMLSPLLSLPLTVKGLIVTVIGGLGSIPGAIIAGLLVGGSRTCSSFSAASPSATSTSCCCCLRFLVFRPGGLFAPPAGRD